MDRLGRACVGATIACGRWTSSAIGPVRAAVSAAPGPMRADAGRMPAWRIMVATSRDWSGRITVTTVPLAPALAVRPERCR